MTAKSRIQYNLPEIFANRPWQKQLMVSLLNGTPLYQWRLNQKFGHLRKGFTQPALDNFVHQSLLLTLSEYRPDLTLVHYTDLDTQKHNFGSKSPQAYEAMHRYDQRLGEVVQVLRDQGMYEKSTLILLGDHGALDEERFIYLNTLLKQKGLITFANGRIKSWRALMKSCDGSCYIYLGEKSETLRKEVEQVLIELKEDEQYGIEALYSSDEAKGLGADPECAFMLEAREGYCFKDEICDEVIDTIKSGTGRVGRASATHGYSPFKPDYTTVFAASGPGIIPHQRIEEMRLIDEGHIMAELLGLRLEDGEGRAIEGLIDYGSKST